MLSQIAILGAGGQVGRALTELLGARAIPLARKQANLADPQRTVDILAALAPRAVINAAAYTQVDKAESDEKNARRINAEAPGVLAQWCAAQQIPLVHYSTDYVFDGSGLAARTEEAPTAPLNIYGATKRDGEERVAAAGGDYLIFRTSWVYDAEGSNFVNTMLRLMTEREELRIVTDQYGAPTYAPHLAAATVQALEHALGMKPFPSGIYHLCGGGETSWLQFAKTIHDLARGRGQRFAVQRLVPQMTADYPCAAKRPLNSRLDCTKAKTILHAALPSWQEGIRECIERKFLF